MSEIDLEPDFGAQAQRAAVKHLEECWQWRDNDENDDWGDEGRKDDPASAPFDGCTTCEVREVLEAAWPILKAGWESEMDAENTAPSFLPVTPRLGAARDE